MRNGPGWIIGRKTEEEGSAIEGTEEKRTREHRRQKDLEGATLTEGMEQ